MGLVLTGYDDLPYGAIGARSWLEYANAHGYDFHCQRTYLAGTHPSWQKLGLILRYLREYEWVFWTDIDSVCTNRDVVLEQWLCDEFWMTVSRDWGAVDTFSAGHMLVKSCEESTGFLRSAQQRTEYENKPLWDQGAMHELVKPSHYAERGIHVLPRRCMNAVPKELMTTCAPWNDGDFLAHVTGGPHARRVPIMEAYAAKGN